MDREPTLWERQLQKQTATGVEAALACLEKRPVVATCTTPACAGELLAAFAASRARPLAFVVVRADAFRTARELAARLAGRGPRVLAAARGAAAAEAVADDGFAEMARAAPDDEAVALALREALPRKPAPAPAGDVVVADAAWLRAVLLGAAAAAYDGAALRAAPAAFAADALADDAASDCATLLRASNADRAVLAIFADAASGKPCRKWLDASSATVRPRDAPPRLCVLPRGGAAPLDVRGPSRADAPAEAPWLRALSLRDRGGGDGDDDAVAAALHFVAVARARPGRRPPPVVVYVDDGERAERLAARLAAELERSADADAGSLAALAAAARARGAPKHAVAAALADVARGAAAWHGGAPRWRRELVEIAASERLTAAVVATVGFPRRCPRAVVACAPRGGLEAYESLAAPAFDGGEAVACHVLGDEPRAFWDRWRAGAWLGAPAPKPRNAPLFPAPRLFLATTLRALASTGRPEVARDLADASLAAAADAAAAKVLKRHAEDLDGAAPAASPADERTCVAERLRALARRAQGPFLRRGRVGRVDGARWCVVLADEVAGDGAVAAVAEAAPGAAWRPERVPLERLRLAALVVAVAAEPERPAALDATRRAVAEALEALRGDGSTKKKRKRPAAIPFLDALGAVEIAREPDRTAAAALTARLAALDEALGGAAAADELSLEDRAALERRVVARHAADAQRSAAKDRGDASRGCGRGLKALKKLGCAGGARGTALLGLLAAWPVGGDDRRPLAALVAAAPDGAASPLADLGPAALAFVAAGLAFAPDEAPEAAFSSLAAPAPDAPVDRSEVPALTAARGAVDGAARAVARACAPSGGLVAEELFARSLAPAGPAAAVARVAAGATVARAAADARAAPGPLARRVAETRDVLAALGAAAAALDAGAVVAALARARDALPREGASLYAPAAG